MTRYLTEAHVRAAGFFLLGLSVGSLLMVVASSVWAAYDRPDAVGEVMVSGSISGPVMERSEPVTLRIPRLDISAPFSKPLGLNENGTVEVPSSFTTVGWYRHGPTPGERGPAVVLGHVDSYEGPAIFFRLGQLEPGDEIFIEREDGTTARFIVDGLKRYTREGFPTETVYGDIGHAGLRLITCSGTYDRGRQVYSHNLVVFAHLADEDGEDGGDS